MSQPCTHQIFADDSNCELRFSGAFHARIRLFRLQEASSLHEEAQRKISDGHNNIDNI